jgi:hypothetical protein
MWATGGGDAGTGLCGGIDIAGVGGVGGAGWI